jgi:hypothetical protein
VYLGAHTTEEEAQVVKARNPEVELSAALAEASATTLRALELAKEGAYARAREMLTKGSEAATAQAKRTPSATLVKHADDMVAVAKDLPAADRPPPAAAEGYEFQDDALKSPDPSPAQVVSPSVAKRRKEAHSNAMESLGH